MLNPFFKGCAKIRAFNHHCNEPQRIKASAIFAVQPLQMSFDSSSVLVVGTVAFDSIKTPFGARERIVGGAGNYIGWSASRLGVGAGLVSVIGEDFPDAELKAMESAGMMLNGVEFDLLGHVTKGAIRVDDEDWGTVSDYAKPYQNALGEVLEG